jgi:hypothetical protein
LVDWPAICKKYSWDQKALCGPVIMATCAVAHTNCISGHPHNCAAHKAPNVNGKPFKLEDHKQELMILGLTKKVDQLGRDKTPSGQPKMVGKTPVYAAQHFA